MSKIVSVIAVFNTAKDVKPIRYTLDGEKYKIDKVVSKFETKTAMVFHCMVRCELVVLILNLETNLWSVD
jgi:hypothetical protein